jgi:hypothetical protein
MKTLRIRNTITIKDKKNNVYYYSTLRYADRARKIKNKPIVNKVCLLSALVYIPYFFGYLLMEIPLVPLGPFGECLPRVMLHPSILTPNLFPSREEQPALCDFCNFS